MKLWLIVWLIPAALIVTLRLTRKIAGSGILFGFLLSFWTHYWIAAFLYTLPWYSYGWQALWYRGFTVEWVEDGFRLSTYAIIAFAFGSLLLAPLILNVFKRPMVAPTTHAPDPRLAKYYILWGLVFYLVLTPFLGKIPTVSAVLSSGLNLTVTGCALALFQTWQEGSRLLFFQRFIVIFFALPFLSLVNQGFLSFGALGLLAVLTFVAGFYRPRWKLFLLSFVLGYLGLSFFVTYMRDRPLIREVVWGRERFVARVERLIETFITVEWLDLKKDSHLRAIDGRFNQNLLVGAAVDQLSRSGEFVRGETLLAAITTPIPRIIWPGKPVYAGSGNLVARFTGLKFSPGTAIGIGPVMEFYANFGVTGVVAGFICLGVIITVIDWAARERLLKGDWQGFTLWFLPGISLLQFTGNTVEIVGTALVGIVLASLVNQSLRRYRGKKILWRAARMR